ncbi:MAG: MFS transporter [Eubacteriaceae bacterium]
MMEQKKSNIFKEKGKILVPLLLFIIFQSAFNAFSPILSQLAERFPDASTTTIQMVLSFPSLVSIPVSISAGLLASYIHKKRLVQIALTVMLVGGILPILIHSSIITVFVSSGFIGLGQGLLISLSGALIAEHFDGNQRGTVFGFKQVASSVGIAGLTVLVGYLGTIAWYNAYLIYFLLVPILILVSKFLPLGKLDEKLVGKGVGLSGIKSLLTPSYIYMCFMVFFMGALLFTFYANIAMMITEKSLGDSSAVGQVTALNSLMTIVVGLIFGFILKGLKKYTLSLAMLVMCLAFLILSISNSFSIIAFGGIVFGIGAGLQQASSLYYVSESVSKSSNTLAIAIALALISVGISFSPVIVNSIQGTVFGSITATSSMLVAGCGYGIMLITELVRETFFNKDSMIGKPITETAQNDKDAK